MFKQCALALAALASTAAFHAASVPRDQTKTRQTATPTPTPQPTMTAAPTTSGGTVPTPKGGAPQKETPPTEGVGLWVKGGHGHWCRGVGICFIKGSRDHGPHCKSVPVRPEGENVFEGVGTIDKKFLTVEFTNGPAERAERLPIDDNIVLDQCTSSGFGYDSLTILKGTYRVSYDGSKYGKVSLRYKAGRPVRVDTTRR